MTATTVSPRRDLVAVIPALNCAKTIAPLVEGVLRAVGRVIVVDDGSADETGALASKAGAEVVRHPQRSGKGKALRDGIAAALISQPAAIVLLDGDGQHDPADLPALITRWDEGDIDLVVGARLSDRDAIPPARYWTNSIGSSILSFMTGYRLEDSQSGYRLVRASLLEAMRLCSDGYAIESEMLIKAAKRKARLAHVRVRTIYAAADELPSSHFQPVRDTFRISLSALRFKVFSRG